MTTGRQSEYGGRPLGSPSHGSTGDMNFKVTISTLGHLHRESG